MSGLPQEDSLPSKALSSGILRGQGLSQPREDLGQMPCVMWDSWHTRPMPLQPVTQGILSASCLFLATIVGIKCFGTNVWVGLNFFGSTCRSMVFLKTLLGMLQRWSLLAKATASIVLVMAATEGGRAVGLPGKKCVPVASGG